MAKKKFHLTYNAPVTLTFAFICLAIFLLENYVPVLKEKLIPLIFTAPGNKNCSMAFNWKNAADYFRMIFHIFGHANWNHLLGNFSFILLLGPLLEERYGSKMICIMVFVTSLVTGVVNACLIPHPLLGASGIAFMFIVLSSIVTLDKKEIPLSFILIVALFIGREIYFALISQNSASISIVAHIVGGICGSLFGFLVAPKARKQRNADKTAVMEKTPKSENPESPELDSFGEIEKKSNKSKSSEKNDVISEIGTIDFQ